MLIDITDIVKIGENFDTYKQRETGRERFEEEKDELHKRNHIILEDRRRSKRNFYDLHKDLYFWYNKKRGQHEQALNSSNSFNYKGYEAIFDKRNDRFEGRANAAILL